jgi:hypothetical protein
MRLVVAATGQAYVVHPTAKFQQQGKHNMAMVWTLIQLKQ